MVPPETPAPVRLRPTALLASMALMLATIVVLATPASAVDSTSDLSGSLTATDLAELLAGEGVAVSNAAYSGNVTAAGTFAGGAASVGMGAGVVLSSGMIADVIGPNDNSATTTAFGEPGDEDLSTLAQNDTFDAAVLEFDFVPVTDTVAFDYVFSSEEYLEFVGGGVNDTFGFFVNGTNCALVGDPSVPVTIDTINTDSNSGLYIDNGDATLDTQMDGLTVVLTCAASVTPGQPNEMKLAIADAGDAVVDSAVFLGQGTFSAVRTLTVATAGEGSGTVTSDPAGIDCGTDCSEGYEDGALVSLTATADEGSEFTGWTGACEGTGPCDLTMTESLDVTATFDLVDTGGCPPETECDSGTLAPGEQLTTVTGTGNNPVSPGDPFALALKNASGGTITGTIVEEPCDGTQEGDPLCAVPRIAGSAGNFQFSIGGGALTTQTATGPRPVTVAKLFYDRSVIRPRAPVKIFYQKDPGGPVLRLFRCDDGVRTECFTLRKLMTGDQIVRVPLSSDPRITRG